MKLAELSDYQISLIDPVDRLKLGLASEPATQPARDQNHVFCGSGASGRAIHPIGSETDQHNEVLKWAKWQELHVLHARTSEAVHDLPPGWPDFTLLYADRALLIEMKVNNRWRECQLQMLAALLRNGTAVLITADAYSTIAAIKEWLASNFGWRPK